MSACPRTDGKKTHHEAFYVNLPLKIWEEFIHIKPNFPILPWNMTIYNLCERRAVKNPCPNGHGFFM